MRELVLTMAMSLDGFVAGPEGEIDWVFGGDQQAIAWKVATVSDASLHVMGSRTFRDMARFWPTDAGAFAPPMNEIPKAVFSKQGSAVLDAAATTSRREPAATAPDQALPLPLQPGADSWGEAYVAGGDLTEEIARLKVPDGRPIVAHGGATFARSLVAAGVVDRYALLVYPLALGHGLPIFDALAARLRLTLVSTTAFPGGTLAQVYRPT